MHVARRQVTWPGGDVRENLRSRASIPTSDDAFMVELCVVEPVVAKWFVLDCEAHRDDGVVGRCGSACSSEVVLCLASTTLAGVILGRSTSVFVRAVFLARSCICRSVRVSYVPQGRCTR